MEMPVAYSGKEKYIFVSYAHKDSDKVIPIISQLMEYGYRIWFDDGIDPGSEWDQNIATHLEGCGCFVSFVTDNYIASANCKDELSYARTLEKKQVVVFLENANVPSGIRMIISNLETVYKNKCKTLDDFYGKLTACKGIGDCKDGQATPHYDLGATTKAGIRLEIVRLILEGISLLCAFLYMFFGVSLYPFSFLFTVPCVLLTIHTVGHWKKMTSEEKRISLLAFVMTWGVVSISIPNMQGMDASSMPVFLALGFLPGIVYAIFYKYI